MTSATPADEARRAIEAAGFGWTSVVDDGELRGWVDLEAPSGRVDGRARRRSVRSAPT